MKVSATVLAESTFAMHACCLVQRQEIGVTYHKLYIECSVCVYRDLAARNVLIQSPEHVQITDFGLAKMLDSLDEDSVVVRSGRVPIRWLAIETLQYGLYSHKTDVWSYGVTLWEIFTFGKQPYENIKTVDIKDHVMKGGRLTQPDICTLDAYMVMVKCKS
ncbi:unnamed protein product [Dibothriocephalus latus]|uniref:Protein kinase domain-containing protein n=1 Tax=Dibothriocephalus latus TaxID=60516 RepID=A0A3P7N1D3_DIBLA|nr:unnamed protein product [Dibothriocephalus latus]